MRNIAIMASGSGTNAENIIQHFRDHPDIHVALVLSNKKDAYVLKRAESFDIETFVFTRTQFYETREVIDLLKRHGIDLVVLAGFLWLVPLSMIEAYNQRIVNIHPALLPKYGGKGMYGHFVHETVLENGEKESGISIHLVNERYDEGDILFQATCPTKEDDTAESLADRVHELEYAHYPRVIEKLINSLE